MKNEHLTGAHRILAHLRSKEIHVTSEDIAETWREVESRANIEKKRAVRRNIFLRAGIPSAVAAVAALILYLAGGFRSLNDESIMDFVQTVMTEETENGAILLLTADGQRMEINETDALIRCHENGTISINSNNLSGLHELSCDFNRLIIPKGKKANLILSDGTDIWANSATRLVWPAEFRRDRREIYVEGETYLDVARDEGRPFMVKTSKFDIKVLGTSFNVSAYPSDPASSVVLVEGKVNIIGQGQREVNMNPGQLVSIREGNPKKPVTVDVKPYVCWVDNLLIYEDERLENVFRKLGLHYDKNFVLDSGVGEMLVSGKLDLNHGYKHVLKTISYVVPVSFEEGNGNIINVNLE